MDNNIMMEQIKILADKAGFGKEYKEFEERIEKFNLAKQRKFAILGGKNSGKSTILNLIAGREAAPVSVVAGKHDAITVNDIIDNLDIVELDCGKYIEDQTYSADNELWGIDSAFYLVSAISPLTSYDISAIKTILAQGIDCCIILTKTDMLDADQFEEVREYVNRICSETFGQLEVLSFQNKSSDEMKKELIDIINRTESMKDVQSFLLSIRFAIVLKQLIGKKIIESKSVLDNIIKKDELQNDILISDTLKWDRIEIGFREREEELLKVIKNRFTRGQEEFTSTLLDSAKRAQSVKHWWMNEFDKKIIELSKAFEEEVGKIVESSTKADQSWLVDEVYREFSVDLKLVNERGAWKFADADKANINKITSKVKSKFPVAAACVAVSAAALVGTIVFPPLTTPVISKLFSWPVAGLACAGSTAFLVSSMENDKKEQQKAVQAGIINIVTSCFETNREQLKKQLHVANERMLIALRDAQFSAMPKSDDHELEEVKEQINLLNKIDAECDTIINSLM